MKRNEFLDKWKQQVENPKDLEKDLRLFLRECTEYPGYDEILNQSGDSDFRSFKSGVLIHFIKNIYKYIQILSNKTNKNGVLIFYI